MPRQDAYVRGVDLGPRGRVAAFPLFPTAATTGVKPGTVLTTYAGPRPVTVNGTIIENKLINGADLTISANDVIIRNCELNTGLVVSSGKSNLTLEDVTWISGVITPPAVGYTHRRTRVTPDYPRDGMPITPTVSVASNYNIIDCFVSGLRADPGAHLDAVQFYPAGGTVNDIVIRHNWLEAIDSDATPTTLANAALFLADGTYGNVLVEHNYFNATGLYPLRLYSDTATSGHIVRSNRWGRASGVPADLYRMTPAIWTDNLYQDNGEVIPQPTVRTV